MYNSCERHEPNLTGGGIDVGNELGARGAVVHHVVHDVRVAAGEGELGGADNLELQGGRVQMHVRAMLQVLRLGHVKILKQARAKGY
jgi:hypothetical protein